MSIDLTTIPDDVLAAELSRRAQSRQDTVSDPLHQLMIADAQAKQQAADDQVAVAEPQARKTARSARGKLNALVGMPAEHIMVEVRIDDPYDLLYSGDQTGSVKVIERGLRRAVQAAEREHARAAGGVRTDGALGYTVTAFGPFGGVPVPERLWLPHSQQTPVSMDKRREAERRMRGR